jgi:predicted porin
MQKKAIALAVAGLVSGVAFAQSNVVVYGVADMAKASLSTLPSGTGYEQGFQVGIRHMF